LPYLLAGLVCALLIGGTVELVTHLVSANQVERQRAETLNKLSTLRARLEGEINSTLHLTRGLIAFVATHPDPDELEFTLLASEIISVGRSIRNIGLARNNVITHIYPLAGNEAALGLAYEENPAQWPAVKKAMELKGTIVAGPVDLIQGGQAFIARTPIYTRTGVSGFLAKDKPEYWGIASIVIDMPSLFQKAGIAGDSDGIEYAMRGRDGLGERGELFLGSEDVFDKQPVLQSVLLPNGSWQIAARPQDGWGASSTALWIIRVSGWLLALTIGALIAALLWARTANRRLALHDHLTGLPHRRLLEDRLQQMIAHSQRDQTSFGLLYVDLDGFKRINDRFGHKVGDGVLVEVAKRMSSHVRAIDTVARIGGDEFIILTGSISGPEEMDKMRGHLQENLLGVAYIDDHQVEVGASIGMAIYPRDGATIDELLKQGDRDMYSVKNAGKVHRLNLAQPS